MESHALELLLVVQRQKEVMQELEAMEASQQLELQEIVEKHEADLDPLLTRLTLANQEFQKIVEQI